MISNFNKKILPANVAYSFPTKKGILHVCKMH